MNDDRIITMVESAVEKAIAAYFAPNKQILVSRKAAAIRLGVDVSTLWRWDKSGYLPVTCDVGSSYTILRRQSAAWSQVRSYSRGGRR